MEMSMRKLYKFDLFLALIFFIGFFLIGILPWALYGSGFWEQNIFLIIVSSIFGFILFVIGFVYIYISTLSFKPKLLIPNILQVCNIIFMLFTIDSLLMAENNIFSLEISVWLFLSIGIFVILSNLYLYIEYKDFSLAYYKDMTNDIQKLNFPKYDQKDLFFLVYYIIIGMFAVIITDDFESVFDYIIIFIFNCFFIYKYLKMVKLNQNKKLISLTLSLALYGLVIYLFVTFNGFINQHVVIKSILFVLPLIHLMPLVIKAYYVIKLKELLR